MRLGGPIFKPVKNLKEVIDAHRKAGFAASYCPYIVDRIEREECKSAFAEADIIFAEYGAYGLNILDTDKNNSEKNITEICKRLEYADQMGALCCVMLGGTVQTGGWGQPGGWGHANPENLSEKSFNKTIEIVQHIIDSVKPEKTKLVIETESYLLPDNPQVYLDLLKTIDRPSFAVHLDPVNIISSPRLFYYNADFIKECFAKLGPWIVSCHAKDVLIYNHATVSINETYLGNGFLDYGVYLKEINKLETPPPLMIEHLNEEQIIKASKYIFKIAEENGIQFKHSELREA